MSIYIVSGIIALLIILVAYAFISHTLEKRRLQRQRLLTALKNRERNFKYMITGLPQHFLSNELSALVYRALIETCEQLAKLSPNDHTHKTDAKLYASQLDTLKHSSESQRVRLDSPAQIKEVRQHLQELYHFVAQQEARQAINAVQAAAYSDQIKRLILQISVDSHAIQARQAQQQGKLRLAIHYYSLSRKLLTGENAGHSYDKQITQIQTIIAKLEALAASQEPPPKTETSKEQEEAASTNKEWEQFSEGNEWKKKQVYD